MTAMKLFCTTGTHITVALLLFFAPMAWAQDEAKPASTIDNLQAAYTGESNAHVRYLAFAAKADAEGYLGTGSLFRAAAKSEQIHANNHAAVLKKLGVVPTAKTEEPVVKSTMENLKTALDGESYERDKMYPDFIKKAEADGNKPAVRTFNWAVKAEGEHANLFVSALARPDQWQKNVKDFLVCPNCGYTTRDMAVQKCPVCGEPRNKLEDIK
jgi:rubrerythrin